MKRMMIPLALTLLTLTLLTGCVVVPMAPGGSVYSPPLPPPLAFQAPPVVIVIPDTDNVYVVPDISADLFFWNGFWWRLNNGFWYRSQYYDRGWGYYNNVPTFYHDVDLGWRGYYKNKNWNGHRWNYERIPNLELQQNWKSWQDNRYWESKKRWGVENYQPRPQQQRQELRRQREEQYQKRHQGQPLQDQPPQVHDPKKPPQGQQPQGTPQVQPPQDQPPQVNDPKKPPQDQQPQEHPPQPAQPQGRPEGGR